MSFATFDEPETDQVYVSGLPSGTTEEDLAAHFGAIGMIKEDKQKGKLKIWLYQDKATGEMKGDGTVSYVDPFSAASAVEWFNNKDFKGSIISVSLALKGGQVSSRGAPSHGQKNNQSFERQPYPSREESHRAAAPITAPITLPPPPQSALGNFPANQTATNDQAAGFLESLQPPGPPPNPVISHGPPMDAGMMMPPLQMMNQGGGGGPPAPKELREGDWLCPGCGNTNFAFRGKCNRCQTPKPGGGAGGGRGRGRGRGRDDFGGRGGRGRGVQAAPQGPRGLFVEGDWTCASCGNTNWARRPTCNLCNGPKPGTMEQSREGIGGGFKELDEAENEEAKRRRLENEEKSMYDEFGRLKKKFRKGEDRKAREAAALARLRGDPLPEEEPDGDEKDKSSAQTADRSSHEKSSRHRESETDRQKERDRDEDRDRDRRKERSRDRHRDRR